MKYGDFIHLCQPDADKSCGACCGLYNYADSTKESVVARLRRRTDLFRTIAVCPDGVREFSEMVVRSEDQTKLYEVIYCCEYLGFIDDREKKSAVLFIRRGTTALICVMYLFMERSCVKGTSVQVIIISRTQSSWRSSTVRTTGIFMVSA